MYLSVSGLLLKNKVRERKGPRTCLGGHKMKGRIRALAFVSRIICTGNRPRIRMQGPKCLLPLPPPPTILRSPWRQQCHEHSLQQWAAVGTEETLRRASTNCRCGSSTRGLNTQGSKQPAVATTPETAGLDTRQGQAVSTELGKGSRAAAPACPLF